MGLFNGNLPLAATNPSLLANVRQGAMTKGPAIDKASLGPEVMGTPTPRRPRGLFGGAAQLLRQGFSGIGKWMEHEGPNGISNRERLGLAGIALGGDPQAMMFAQQMMLNRQDREQEAIGERRDQKASMQLGQTRRREALEYGLEEGSPLFGLYQMDPERALTQLNEQQTTPPSSAFSRDRVDGTETVFERFNPQSREWEEISRGPRWEPDAPGQSDRPSMGSVMGGILDQMARGEPLSPHQEAALDRYERLQRRPDPFAAFMSPPEASAPAGGQAQSGAGVSPNNPASPQSQEDFDALPSGAWFVNPADGRLMQKR